MLETTRSNGGDDWIELDFVEREATPGPPMKLGIQLHLGELLLSITILIFDILGVVRCRSTVHNRVQKVDLQPLERADPDHVAVDETVIQLNDEQCWLYPAVDPAMNRLLHFKPSPTRIQAVIEIYLPEPSVNHLVDRALFLVDFALWLQAALHRQGLDHSFEKPGNRNSVERVSQELKQRTNQF